MHVLATAGHVDHGKSSLVRALTGIDPDRWAEEKARGLTIDLGFASLALPSGRQLSIVDVPGHVRFLKNMLAGVGAVDACMFIVSATEGWKPQSEEHLRILELVGVRHGVVVITKADLADPDLLDLARLDVAEHTARSFLEGADVIAVDSLSGRGLDELRTALDALVERTPPAADVDRPRLWIDRAFAAKGAGTVVTGTLAGGTIRVDDELWLVQPDVRVRVRAIQTHHQARDEVGPGNRVALNLVGVSHDRVRRGDVLVRPSQFHVTPRVDATLEVLASLSHVVSRRGAYAAYIGSGEWPVRVRVLGADSIHPGASGLVRLHLATALPLVPGDRYVLRESGRDETVGGGEVLDVEPVLPAARARPDRSVERIVAERGWVDAAHLTRLTGQPQTPTLGRWVVHPPALAATHESLRERIASAGPLGLDLAALDERARAALELLDEFVIDGGRVRPAAQRDPLADHPFLAALCASPLSPPDPVGVDRGELQALIRTGRVIESGGCYFAAEAVQAAARVCIELLKDHPDGFTVSDFRVAAGNTRKHAVPLLSYLDSVGATRRRNDRRIAGPRLATTAGEPQ
ncbi:MAG TPA: selenocysteine-specific translation elongation factor [Acidimicrobiales bacterium]